MKIKILKIEKGEVETVYIEAKPPEDGIYRRFGKDIWEHYQGPNWGWGEYRFTDLLEAAYEKWVRNEKSKAIDK